MPQLAPLAVEEYYNRCDVRAVRSPSPYPTKRPRRTAVVPRLARCEGMMSTHSS